MPSPKYRSVNVDDYNDNSLVGNLDDATSFELEDEYVIIKTDKTPRRKLVCSVVCLLVFLVVAVVYSLNHIGDNGRKESQHVFDQVETSFKLFNTSGDQVSSVITDSEHSLHQHEKNNNTHKLVYCYGDSLTYGMVPHSREPHPYAPYLERELNILYNNNNSYIVKHFGFPVGHLMICITISMMIFPTWEFVQL
jgi:hypothetical protein